MNEDARKGARGARRKPRPFVCSGSCRRVAMPCGMCKRRRRDPCPSKCRVGDCGRDKPVPPEKGDSLLHCGVPGGTRLSRPGSATIREGRACRVRALRRSGRSGRDALVASGLRDVPGGTRFRIDMHCSEVKSRTWSRQGHQEFRKFRSRLYSLVRFAHL